jgi:hypothetical protein
MASRMTSSVLPLPAVFLLSVLGLLLVARRASRRQLEDLRRIGLYPAEGKGTEAHVLGLARKGETRAAVRLYRELRGGSSKNAKKAVQRLLEGD